MELLQLEDIGAAHHELPEVVELGRAILAVQNRLVGPVAFVGVVDVGLTRAEKQLCFQRPAPGAAEQQCEKNGDDVPLPKHDQPMKTLKKYSTNPTDGRCDPVKLVKVR